MTAHWVANASCPSRHTTGGFKGECFQALKVLPEQAMNAPETQNSLAHGGHCTTSLYLLLLLLQMSIIMVALSHYCCRTTLQCHCHVSQTKQQPQHICPQLFSRNTKNVSIHRETLPKQHSLQFPTEGIHVISQSAELHNLWVSCYVWLWVDIPLPWLWPTGQR